MKSQNIADTKKWKRGGKIIMEINVKDLIVESAIMRRSLRRLKLNIVLLIIQTKILYENNINYPIIRTKWI